MKEPMKTIAQLIASVIVFWIVTIFIGCATNQPGQPTVSTSQLVTIAKLAAFDGTVLYLKAHPEHRIAFVTAHAALDSVLKNGDGKINAADFLNILRMLPIDELKGPEGSLIVGNAVIIFTEFFKEGIDIDASELKPVAEAVRDGLGQGLGL